MGVFMKYFTLIFCFLLINCADSSNNTIDAKKENNAKLVESFDLIDSFGVPLRTNQYYYSSSIFTDKNNELCQYTELRKESLIKENGESFDLLIENSYTALNNIPVNCPSPMSLQSQKTITKNTNTFIQDTKENMRFFADADYRCKSSPRCSFASFISKTTENLDGHTYDLYITEQTNKDGTQWIYEAYLSRLSYFEGVVQFSVINKKTKEIFFERKLVKSSIY